MYSHKSINWFQTAPFAATYASEKSAGIAVQNRFGYVHNIGGVLSSSEMQSGTDTIASGVSPRGEVPWRDASVSSRANYVHEHYHAVYNNSLAGSGEFGLFDPSERNPVFPHLDRTVASNFGSIFASTSQPTHIGDDAGETFMSVSFDESTPPQQQCGGYSDQDSFLASSPSHDLPSRLPASVNPHDLHYSVGRQASQHDESRVETISAGNPGESGDIEASVCSDESGFSAAAGAASTSHTAVSNEDVVVPRKSARLAGITAEAKRSIASVNLDSSISSRRQHKSKPAKQRTRGRAPAEAFANAPVAPAGSSATEESDHETDSTSSFESETSENEDASWEGRFIAAVEKANHRTPASARKYSPKRAVFGKTLRPVLNVLVKKIESRELTQFECTYMLEAHFPEWQHKFYAEFVHKVYCGRTLIGYVKLPQSDKKKRAKASERIITKQNASPLFQWWARHYGIEWNVNGEVKPVEGSRSTQSSANL